MKKIEIALSRKALEVVDELRITSGYDDRSAVIQETIFAIKELMKLDSEQTQPASIRGVLATFKRFE